MADSEAAICSSALSLLGAKPIGSLTENSQVARWCARFYPESRREILQMHTWNRATVRQLMALDATAPIFNWAFSFTLPVYCLRVVATDLDKEEGGPGEPWAIEDNAVGAPAIVANVNIIKARFIKDITDTTLFDPLLEKAIRYDLAVKLAYPVTQNSQVQQLYEGLRDTAVQQAKGYDGREGSKRRAISTMFTRDVRA